MGPRAPPIRRPSVALIRLQISGVSVMRNRDGFTAARVGLPRFLAQAGVSYRPENGASPDFPRCLLAAQTVHVLLGFSPGLSLFSFQLPASWGDSAAGTALGRGVHRFSLICALYIQQRWKLGCSVFIGRGVYNSQLGSDTLARRFGLSHSHV
jgi:hypothetical protein